MKYSENDKFKLTVDKEDARAKIKNVYDDTETYMLWVVDEEMPEGYEHFVPKEKLEENWKKDNRLKVDDYYMD